MTVAFRQLIQHYNQVSIQVNRSCTWKYSTCKFAILMQTIQRQYVIKQAYLGWTAVLSIVVVKLCVIQWNILLSISNWRTKIKIPKTSSIQQCRRIYGSIPLTRNWCIWNLQPVEWNMTVGGTIGNLREMSIYGLKEIVQSQNSLISRTNRCWCSYNNRN